MESVSAAAWAIIIAQGVLSTLVVVISIAAANVARSDKRDALSSAERRHGEAERWRSEAASARQLNDSYRNAMAALVSYCTGETPEQAKARMVVPFPLDLNTLIPGAKLPTKEAPDKEGEEVMPLTPISSRAALEVGARTLIATPDALRGWLSAKEPTEVVGECRNPLHCVVSNFLRAQGVAFAAVHPTVSYVSDTANNNYDTARYIPNEPWLERYVNALDKSSGLVTAEQALGLLPK